MKNILAFILAGNATFTIVNHNTGNRFTFKVIQPTKNHPHFVKVLTRTNDKGGFIFLGTIFDKNNFYFGKPSQSVKVFDWLWTYLMNNSFIPEQGDEAE